MDANSKADAAATAYGEAALGAAAAAAHAATLDAPSSSLLARLTSVISSRIPHGSAAQIDALASASAVLAFVASARATLPSTRNDVAMTARLATAVWGKGPESDEAYRAFAREYVTTELELQRAREQQLRCRLAALAVSQVPNLDSSPVAAVPLSLFLARSGDRGGPGSLALIRPDGSRGSESRERISAMLERAAACFEAAAAVYRGGDMPTPPPALPAEFDKRMCADVADVAESLNGGRNYDIPAIMPPPHALLPLLQTAADAVTPLADGVDINEWRRTGLLPTLPLLSVLRPILFALLPLFDRAARGRLDTSDVPGRGGRIMTSETPASLHGFPTTVFRGFFTRLFLRVHLLESPAHGDACESHCLFDIPEFSTAELLLAHPGAEKQSAHLDSEEGTMSAAVAVLPIADSNSTRVRPGSHLPRERSGTSIATLQERSLGKVDTGDFFAMDSTVVHYGAANSDPMLRIFFYVRYLDKHGKRAVDAAGRCVATAGPLARAAAAVAAERLDFKQLHPDPAFKLDRAFKIDPVPT